jgi:hypothetical protein
LEPEEIKGDVAGAARAAEKVNENRAAGLIGRDHLAVKNGIVDVERSRYLAGELVQPGHDVVVARD